MSSAPITARPPAVWERALSTLAFLALLITPLAIVVGPMLYGALRRRHPFVAHHGLHAAGWQLFAIFLQVMLIVLYLVAKVLASVFPGMGLPPASFDYPSTNPDVSARLTEFVEHLLMRFPETWAVLGLPARAQVVLVAAAIGLTLAVMVCGVVTVLRGKLFNVPIIGGRLNRMFKSAPNGDA